MLPKLCRPRILDIGCGPGGPTLELARLSQGEVMGVDIHQPYLDELTKRVRQAGLSDRVKGVHCSVFNMEFPDESFDIIWAEGSIFVIGFEKGLRKWRRLIQPSGFLVVHEMVWLQPNPPQEISDYWKGVYPGISTVSENLELIPRCGYRLLGHFALPEDAWWIEYYGPLEKRLKKLCRKYADNPEALAVIEREQKEIDLFRKYSKWYESAFFVMQKR